MTPTRRHERHDPLADPSSFRFGRFVRSTAGRLLLALFRVRFLNADRVPASGAILAGNHVSYADPALLWCGSPRQCHFMAKSELWEIGWLGWGLDKFWAFPVRRGEADRQAIQVATELLRSGELVGIFPEGTRKHEGMGEGQQGAAFIASRAGVPIVPVGIVGTDRIKPRGTRLMRFPRVTMSYGEPVYAEMFEGGRKEKIEAMTAEVMRRIADEVRTASGAGRSGSPSGAEHGDGEGGQDAR